MWFVMTSCHHLSRRAGGRNVSVHCTLWRRTLTHRNTMCVYVPFAVIPVVWVDWIFLLSFSFCAPVQSTLSMENCVFWCIGSYCYWIPYTLFWLNRVMSKSCNEWEESEVLSLYSSSFHIPSFQHAERFLVFKQFHFFRLLSMYTHWISFKKKYLHKSMQYTVGLKL